MHVLLPLGQFIECFFGYPKYSLELLVRQIELDIQKKKKKKTLIPIPRTN